MNVVMRQENYEAFKAEYRKNNKEKILKFRKDIERILREEVDQEGLKKRIGQYASIPNSWIFDMAVQIYNERFIKSS